MAVSPDGRRLVAANGVDGVLVWDLETRKQLDNFKPLDRCYQVSYSPDGKHLVVVSSNAARVLNATTGETVFDVPSRLNDITKAWFAPTGHLFVSQANLVEIWDLESRQKLGNLQSPPTAVDAFAFSRDGKVLAMSHHRSSITVHLD